jgi:methylated-DNA-[protein]-cysteine S-methyltransferase
MQKLYKTYYSCEIGILEITGSETGILSIGFVDGDKASQTAVPECLKECVRQLDEYFNCKRKEFDLKLLAQGTDFQIKVWNELLAIPCGKNATYGEIAEKTGNAKASRAVGNANNKNRIAIIIPCHRIIGSNGKLTGYAGGLWRKEWLLEHEKGWDAAHV